MALVLLRIVRLPAWVIGVWSFGFLLSFALALRWYLL